MHKLEVSPAADPDLGRLEDRIRRQDFEGWRDAVDVPMPWLVPVISATLPQLTYHGGPPTMIVRERRT